MCEDRKADRRWVSGKLPMVVTASTWLLSKASQIFADGGRGVVVFGLEHGSRLRQTHIGLLGFLSGQGILSSCLGDDCVEGK